MGWWIVSMIFLSILSSGCTWFGGEGEERIPTAVLKSEGKNPAGYYLVRVDRINYPIRVRNVEISFLDRNDTKVVFSAGRNTTGITLDQIYFADHSGVDHRYQVIYYDIDNDLRLAGTEANHTKDYFIIYPRLGLMNSGNSESWLANLTLVLYWRDDSYVEKNRNNTEELIIGKTLIDSNNTMEKNIIDLENKTNESDTDVNSLLIIVFIIAFLCIVLIFTFLFRKSGKSSENDNIEIPNKNEKTAPNMDE